MLLKAQSLAQSLAHSRFSIRWDLMNELINENFARSLIAHSVLQPDHFPAGGHSSSVSLPSVSWRQEDDREVPRVPSQTAQSKHGPSPSPQLLSPDSLEQDPDGSLVMLVIGNPGRDAIPFWGGTLKFKEKGHIFRVNDKDGLHVAKLLPGGKEKGCGVRNRGEPRRPRATRTGARLVCNHIMAESRAEGAGSGSPFHGVLAVSHPL